MIKFEFSIEQINTLINALNQPMQVGSVTLVGLINMIHEQAAPQIPKEKEVVEDGE